MEIERKRIAVEVPTPIHERVDKYCKSRGYSMTQWVIQLIVRELEKLEKE